MGTWEDSLLINWFHILKICLNAYICQTFFKRIKANQPSSPLGYLSSYLTLFLYLSILFVFTDKLPENIPVWHLNILTIYAGSDIVLMFFAWIIQRNLVARRDELFRFKAGDITQEKKERDLFDIRYMPEEYMSDVEDTSDEEEYCTVCGKGFRSLAVLRSHQTLKHAYRHPLRLYIHSPTYPLWFCVFP